MGGDRTTPWKRAGIGWLFAAMIVLTLAILAGTVLYGRHRIQKSTERRIIGRDGEIFHAIALMNRADALEEAELFADLDDPSVDWRMLLALRISELRGIVAIRVHDEDGRFLQGIPANVRPADAPREARASLLRNQPVSRFEPELPVESIFAASAEADSVPVVSVSIPLFADESSYAGSAEFLVDGASVAREFAALNGQLWWQSGAVFGLAGGVLVFGLGMAFRQIARRTADLREANRQLAMTARTSALGAVAAHLIHGLRNPLSGLHNFVATQSQEAAEADWDSAVASTRRMQTLINEVIGVLREEETGARFELNLDELLEVVAGRVSSLARELGVSLKTERLTDGSLDNRSANLISLVLTNLVQNALQASPRDGAVELRIERRDDAYRFTVRDRGPGLPDHVRRDLFSPVTSAKEGGSGLGLAISNQLARHLDAELQLVSSSIDGTCFALVVPAAGFFSPSK